jgi:hypothetical protein
MSGWQTSYWRLLTIIARLIGVGFALVGGVIAIWGVTLVLDPKATIAVNGVPSSDPWIKASMLVVGLVVSVLGVLLVIARPFRIQGMTSVGKKSAGI